MMTYTIMTFKAPVGSSDDFSTATVSDAEIKRGIFANVQLNWAILQAYFALTDLQASSLPPQGLAGVWEGYRVMIDEVKEGE